MGRSSLSIKLFRALIVGSVVTAGSYIIVQGTQNYNHEKINLGPFRIQFSLDTANSKVTREVCESIKPGESFTCADQVITAVYDDNYRTLAAKIPAANTPNGYPNLVGYHISWDLSNLGSVASDLIVKGQYVEDAESYPVLFVTSAGLPIDTQIVPAGETADIEAASVKARSSDFEEVGKQFAGWDGQYFNIQGPTTLYARYTDRWVEVSISDLKGQSLEKRLVRYGDKLGELPAVPDEYVEADDGYYYWALMELKDGVLSEKATVAADTAVRTKTNAEVFTIQLRKRSFVRVSFVSTTSNGVQVVDTREYSYAEKHVLTAADFTGVDQVDDNGVTVDWSLHYGTVADRDLILYADCSLKTLELRFESYLRDDESSSYVLTPGLLPYEQTSVKYGSVLTEALNVGALNEYRFEYFTVGSDPAQLSESELMSRMFQSDGEIRAYFVRRPATVRFINSYLNGDASAPASIATYVGADNIVFDAVSFFVKAPEGYYFTDKWRYSAKIDGVTTSLIYDSSVGSGDKIVVNAQEVYLEPIFEKITFDVEFYDENGLKLATKKGIFYNENMVAGFKVPDYVPSASNITFDGWVFKPDLSTLSNPSLSTPVLTGVRAGHLDVLAFQAAVTVTEHYINFRADSVKSTIVYQIANTGDKTIREYLDILNSDSSFAEPVKDGFVFQSWYWNSQYADSYIVDIGEDFNILPKYVGATYKVQYHFLVQNGSSYIDHDLTHSFEVQVDTAYRDDMDAVRAEARTVLENSHSAWSDGYEIDSSFYLSSGFNTKTLGTGDIVTYDPLTLSDDPLNPGQKVFNVYVRAVPRTATIYYKAVINHTTYDLAGSNNTYVYNSEADGYHYLWGDRFDFASYAPTIAGVLEFVGWTDGSTEYLAADGYIPNSRFNSSTVTLYAKFRELKVSVNFYGAVTEHGLNIASENAALSSFGSDFRCFKTLAGDSGDDLSFADYQSVVNTYLAALAGTELGGTAYEVTKVRRLGETTEYDLATLDLNAVGSSRDYVFVLTPIAA